MLHPMVVRAILVTQISTAGLEKLRDYEKSVMGMDGRYLQGSEICWCMKAPPKNPTDIVIGWFEALWLAYEREQEWTGRSFEEQHPEIVPRTRLEEIYAWEDYARDHYVRWMSRPMDPQQIFEGVIAARPRLRRKQRVHV